MNWFDRRDDADEFAPADLDELTEALLQYVRPGEPGERLRRETYTTVRPCHICLTDVGPADVCGVCSTVQTWKAKEAA